MRTYRSFSIIQILWYNAPLILDKCRALIQLSKKICFYLIGMVNIINGNLLRASQILIFEINIFNCFFNIGYTKKEKYWKQIPYSFLIYFKYSFFYQYLLISLENFHIFKSFPIMLVSLFSFYSYHIFYGLWRVIMNININNKKLPNIFILCYHY